MLVAGRYCLLFSLLTISLTGCLTIHTEPNLQIPGTVQGTVFLDRDGNGLRGASEPGIAGVAVSNGREVVSTNRNGHYQLPITNGMTIFVVQPEGYQVPVDDHGLPRFYYTHKPDGSAPGLHYSGIAPTGPLPSPLDFALFSSPKQDSFSVLLLGDTQTRTPLEVAYLAMDVVAPLADSSATMAIALGDLVYNDLNIFEPLIETLGTINKTWWPVIGNHDINFRAENDARSAETWTRLFGPTNYAFQMGKVHFVVLDSDIYMGWDEQRSAPGAYREGFGAEELHFLNAYLQTVPQDELVVVAMHVPLMRPEGRMSEQANQILTLLSGHPHTLSISAHAHRQFQLFLGAEHGFTGKGRHHHLNVGATSGSWWRGAPDEYGVPHTTMRDGAPNGYWLAHFEGASYRLEFRPARRPAEHQINISAPFSINAEEASNAEVLANVFAGSERTQVQMRIDQSAWQPMQRTPRADPYYAALVQRERLAPPKNRLRLPKPAISTHIWSGKLPNTLKPGMHIISVRSTDPILGTAQERHFIKVESPLSGSRYALR